MKNATKSYCGFFLSFFCCWGKWKCKNHICCSFRSPLYTFTQIRWLLLLRTLGMWNCLDFFHRICRNTFSAKDTCDASLEFEQKNAFWKAVRLCSLPCASVLGTCLLYDVSKCRPRQLSVFGTEPKCGQFKKIKSYAVPTSALSPYYRWLRLFWFSSGTISWICVRKNLLLNDRELQKTHFFSWCWL